MKLYHYSKEYFSNLKTLKIRNIIIDESTVSDNDYKPGNYDEHISFFLEPVPLDIISSIFKGTNNEIWADGTELYQYEINVINMPEFKYDIVESPTANDFLFNPKYKNLSDEEWLKNLYIKKNKIGEVGNSKKEFLKIANKYVGLLRDDFIKLPSRPNWNEIKTKYAPTCVHVMIYPKGGIINYDNVNKVTIGNKLNKQLADKW